MKSRYLFMTKTVGDQPLKILFFFSLIILNLPVVYFFHKAVSTFRLAEFLWLVILIIISYLSLITEKKLFSKKNSRFLGLIVFFLITQSLSVLTAVNIGVFIFRWEPIFFSTIFVLISTLLIKNKNDVLNLIYVLVFSFLIPILFLLALYFFPYLLQEFMASFIHPKLYNLITFNFDRGRLYGENYNASIVPLLFYLLVISPKKFLRIVVYSLLLIIFFIAFVCNIRSVFLLTAFSFIGSLFVLKQKIAKKIIIVFFLFLFINIFIFTNINKPRVNIIDRLTFQNEKEDYQTIINRLDSWKHAWQIGLSSPVFGVGLYNYFDYVSFPFFIQSRFILNPGVKEAFLSMAADPHNIFFQTFAETGTLGFFSLLFLIFYFIKIDLTIFRQIDNYLSKLLVVSFWSVFLYSLFNPGSGLRFYTLSWLFRVLIEKQKSKI